MKDIDIIEAYANPLLSGIGMEYAKEKARVHGVVARWMPTSGICPNRMWNQTSELQKAELREIIEYKNIVKKHLER